jgi:hypothetical protein
VTRRNPGCLLTGVADPDLARELLSGALLQRILLRRDPPDPMEEREWVNKLLRQVGLVIDLTEIV